MDLKIGVQYKRDVVILEVHGTIDVKATEFIETVGWHIQHKKLDILCNLENVDLVDYAGISVLVIAYKNIINHNGRMRFVHVPLHVRNLINMVCLDRIFEIYDDEETALNSFREDRIIEEIKRRPLRRRFQRLPLETIVYFRPKFSREKNFDEGKLFDLSALGAFVYSPKIYPLNEILLLKTDLHPRPGPVEFQARVVWLADKQLQPHIYPGMGVEFYKIDSALQRKLIAFVERNVSHSSPIWKPSL